MSEDKTDDKTTEKQTHEAETPDDGEAIWAEVTNSTAEGDTFDEELSPEPMDAAEAAPTDAEPDDTPPADEAAGEAEGEASKSTEPSGPFAGATDEQRAYLAKLERERKAAVERARAEQRRNRDLEQRLSKTSRPSEEDGPEASGDDDLDEIAEEYPEIAAPFVKTIREMRGQLEELRGDSQQRAQKDEAAEISAIESDHPDWEDAITTDAFQAWLDDDARTRADIQAYARNEDRIVDGKAVSQLIARFKKDTGFGAETPRERQTQPASARRRAQRDSAAGIRSGGPPASTSMPANGDPEAMWDAIAEREVKRLRGG